MQEPPELQPIRTSRRRRWFASLIILLCLPLLLIAAIVYANRPHWITYTSPPFKGSNLRLSVQMPDTWAPDKWKVIERRKLVHLDFHQREPKGISKWLFEHVFRIKTNTWKKDTIYYDLRIRNDNYKDVPTLIEWLKNSRKRSTPLDPMSLQENRFVLGPALEWQVSPFFRSHTLWDFLTILPDETAPNNAALEINLMFLGDPQHFKQIHPLLLEAAQRIRLTTSSVPNKP